MNIIETAKDSIGYIVNMILFLISFVTTYINLFIISGFDTVKQYIFKPIKNNILIFSNNT